MYNTLQTMIAPKYITWYQDFQDVALVDDKKGIHIMEFILQTRGQKKYDGYLSVDQSCQAQLKSKKFDMKGCEAMMRKKEVTTRYSQDYGYLQTM